jgi:hypothetical protein
VARWESRVDYPNVITSLDMRNYDKAATVREPDQQEAQLSRGVIRIRDCDRKGVGKSCGRLGERQGVLAQIGRGFGPIPGKVQRHAAKVPESRVLRTA